MFVGPLFITSCVLICFIGVAFFVGVVVVFCCVLCRCSCVLWLFSVLFVRVVFVVVLCAVCLLM